MASTEHLQLSNFIKSVHEKLRIDTKHLGCEIAWKTHCEDKETLDKYANAMQDLALNHWEVNCRQLKSFSCVQWTINFIEKYFFNVIEHHRSKEILIADKIRINENINLNINIYKKKCTGKIKMLDVGSCYNPFKQFDLLETLAVDIAPANSDVLACDFLSVKVGRSTAIDYSVVHVLEENFYGVVVFSLLLEYMPNTEQRLLCCQKAYNLLHPEGILVIITPDSKHVGANAKLMKSWRYILARLGFSRIKYEKLPHVHCMVFRKSVHKAIPRRWADLHTTEEFHSEMFIPQDFNDKKNVELCSTGAIFNTDDLISCFKELPNLD